MYCSRLQTPANSSPPAEENFPIIDNTVRIIYMAEAPGVDVSSTITNPSQDRAMQIPSADSSDNKVNRRGFLRRAVGFLGAIAGLTGATAGAVGESAIHGPKQGEPAKGPNPFDKTPVSGTLRPETDIKKVEGSGPPTAISPNQPPELTSYTGDPNVDEGIARKQATSGGLDAAKKRLADSLANNPKAK